jgi:hypothetical protein
MKIRVTTNSEIDPETIVRVERTETGFHVRFADTARQYRLVQLTNEARNLFETFLK